ncbi:MAG: SBBP repeat-containing protein [Polyangiaceae bacterium]|nr:SBBP repeat-containing protein [Polyangiaceae bacterium]
MKSLIFVLTLAACTWACSSRPNDPRAASKTSPLTTTPLPEPGPNLVGGRFVPGPVVVDTTTGKPIEEKDGTFRNAWAGSLSDLLTADAFADCSVSSADYQLSTSPQWSQPGISAEDAGALHGIDAYLGYLEVLMVSSLQAKCHDPNEKSITAQWVQARANPNCNVDTETRKPTARIDVGPNQTAIAAVRRDVGAYATFNGSPTLWKGPKGETLSGAALASAQRAASRELNYADLNLCMAEKLREYTNSPAIFTASARDHEEIVAATRERAQLSMIQYSMLASVFSAWQWSETPSHLVVNDANAFLPLLRAWSDWAQLNSPASLTRVGEDYARATRLTINATQVYADLLSRRASAQPAPSSSEAQGTLGSARTRLMNLLYGGDPLGSPTEPAPPGRGLGGIRGDGSAPPAVLTSLADPKYRLLLVLARDADALDFKLGSPKGIDVVASSTRLHQSLERWILTRECAFKPSDPTCTPDNISTKVAVNLLAGDTLLKKQYGIEASQIKTFVTAFNEAFGEIFTTNNTLPNTVYDGLFHLVGKHSTFQVKPSANVTETWFHVDKRAKVSAFSGNELQAAYARLHWLPSFITMFSAYPQDQGFVATTPAGVATPTDKEKWEHLRAMGAVPALVYARQALLLGVHPKAQSLAPAFFDAAGVALDEVEEAVGTRSFSIQQNQYNTVKKTTTLDCPYSRGAATCARVSLSTHGPIVIQPIDDPHSTLILAANQRGVPEVAADPDHVPFLGGITRANLDTTRPCQQPAQGQAWVVPCKVDALAPTEFVRYGKGRMFRTYGSAAQDVPRLALLQGVVGGKAVYYPLYRDRLFHGADEGYFVGFGGTLNNLAEQTLSPLAEDWSRSATDAFGHESNWVPPTNAALLGGADGQESYQYLLEQAKIAAADAAISVQTAISTISNEAAQTAISEAAVTEAKSNAEFEVKSKCGRTAPENGLKPCEVKRVALALGKEGAGNAKLRMCTVFPAVGVSPKLDNIGLLGNPALTDAPPGLDLGESGNRTLTAIKKHLCEGYIDSVYAALPSLKVAASVHAAGTDAPPAEASGSALGTELVAQWGLVQNLNKALDAAAKLADVHAQDIAIGYKNLDVSWKNFADQRDYINKLIIADANGTSACVAAPTAQNCAGLPQGPQLAAIVDDEAKAMTPKNEADARAHSLCAQEGKPGECPDKDKTIVLPDANANGGAEKTDPEPLPPFAGNPGERCIDRPAYVQRKWGCEDAKTQAENLGTTIKTNGETNTALTALLLNQAVAQAQDLTNQRDTLEKEAQVGRSNLTRRYQAAGSELAPLVIQLQATAGEIFKSNARIDKLKREADKAGSDAALESSFEANKAKARYGINRAFRSYEMWRAEALMHDARNMALAARRAIEGRFVVDLSKINKPQAFVESPYLWADDVYEPDLGAPSVVGVQAIDAIEGAVYPNKLVDYVGNLERFVQGYSTSYPTAIAAPDTEVLTFPGPTQVNSSGASPAAEGEQPTNANWIFYCSQTNTWLTHPSLSRIASSSQPAPAGNPMATLCSGKPPTRARYKFTLDPWGRLTGYFASSPLYQRYNTRWRRLAANLVGSGIRDCARATNPKDCQANSFIRYSLNHVGPYWVTDHAQNWVDLALPSANIEGAKAIASETWLNPTTHNLKDSSVANVARQEFFGRPVDGDYELTIELTPDVRLERIERVQLLTEQDYWVRQGATTDPSISDPLDPNPPVFVGAGGSTGAGGSVGAGGSAGAAGAGGSGATGGSGGSGGTPPVADQIGVGKVAQWGTSTNEYVSQIVTGTDGSIYAAGYSTGDLDGNANRGAEDAYFTKWNATTGARLWTKTYGTSATDFCTGIATDGQGHFYLAIQTQGELFAPNLGNVDSALIKLDENGSILWGRQWGTAKKDGATKVAVDAQGNVFVTGLWNGNGVADVDVALAKFSPDGDMLWNKSWGSPGGEWGTGVAIGSEGDAFVVGPTEGPLFGPSLGCRDGFVMRVNGVDGSLKWGRQLGGPGWDFSGRLDIDRSGDLLVPMRLGESGCDPQGATRSKLLKLSAVDGGEIWSRTSGLGDAGLAVRTDADNTVYLAGTTKNELETGHYVGGSDLFLQKWTRDGCLLWTKQWGSTGNDVVGDVFLLNKTTLLYAGGAAESVGGGVFHGVIDNLIIGVDVSAGTPSTIQASAGVRQWGSASAEGNGEAVRDAAGNVITTTFTQGSVCGANRGASDVLIQKHSPTGKAIWSLQLGSSGEDYPSGLTLAPNGNILLAGQTTGDWFSPPAGGRDAVLLELDPAGNTVLGKQWGSAANDQPYALIAPTDNDLYVGGTTLGDLAGAQAGQGDAFVSRLNRAGDVVWTKQWGAAQLDRVSGLSADAVGNVVASGLTDMVTATGCSAAFVTKLTPTDGSTLWNQRWSAAGTYKAQQPLFDTSGALFVTGVKGDNADCSKAAPYVHRLDASTGQVLSTTSWGDPNTFNLALRITETSPDGLAVLSNTDGPYPGTLASESRDVALTYLLKTGEIQWHQRWGSAGLDLGFGMTNAMNGELALVGATYGALGSSLNLGSSDSFLVYADTTSPPGQSLLPSTEVANVNRSNVLDRTGARYTVETIVAQPAGAYGAPADAKGVDIALTKRDATGGTVWTRQWGSPADEGLTGGHSLATTWDDTVIVVGNTAGSIDGNRTLGLTDAFATKWAADGTKLWTRQLGTSGADLASGVAVDPVGNLYVAGSSEGTFAGNLSAGKTDAFVAKFDPTGVLQWTRQYGEIGSEWVKAIAVGANGDLWVTGSTTSSWAAVNTGCRDVFIAKIDPSDGTLLGIFQSGTAGDDNGQDLNVDPTGQVLLTSSWNGSHNCPGGGDGQARLTKLNPNGAEIWAREWGSSAADTPTALAVDDVGSGWVTGYTQGGLFGYFSHGGSDAFLTKFQANGEQVWGRQWGSPADDRLFDVALLPNEQAELVGFTQGDLGGVNLDSGTRLRMLSAPLGTPDTWTPSNEPSLVQWLSPRRGVQIAANSAITTVVDQSSYGNTASQTVATKRPTLSYDSGAPTFKFDGVSQYLEAPDSPSLSWTNKGTYAFWVKFDEPNNPREEDVLTQWHPGNRFLFRKYMSASGPMLAWYAGTAISYNFTRASTPIDDQWHFWAFEFDGSLPVAERMKVYRDGVRMSPVVDNSIEAPPHVWLPPPAALLDSSGPMDIGSYVPGGVPKFLKGAIGSIYVFRDVLRDDHRTRLMSLEAPQTAPPAGSTYVAQPALPGSSGSTVQSNSAGDANRPLQTLSAPEAAALDRAGNLYVATTGSAAASQSDIVLSKWSANGTWLWSRTWGTLAEERVHDLQIDVNENVALVGDTKGSLFTNNAGARDSFTLKVSPNGALIGAYQWGGQNDDSAMAIQVDPQGATLVAGLSGGTGGESYTTGDIDVLKLSATGATLWRKTWGSLGAEWATGASLDPQGNLFISGRTDGALTQANAGCSDAFAAKLNGADGTLTWQQQWGSTGGDWAKKGTIDVNGDFVTAGFADDAACSGLSGHAVLRKVSGATGEEVWTRHFPSEATDALTLATRPDGTILVGGRALGAFAPTGVSAGGDAYLAKWSEDGCELWRQQWGTSGEEAASALAIKPDGTAIVAGFTTGQFPNAPGPNGIFLTSIDAAPGVPNVIHKSGNVWQFGTAANDEAKAQYDRDGNVILSGYTFGAMCGPSRGGTDVYVRKVTPQGRPIWSVQLGTPADDLPNRLQISPSGMIHLAAYTKGSWFGPSAGDNDNVYLALDRAGNLVRSKQWGTAQTDVLLALAVASDSEIYVGGQAPGSDARDAVVYRLNAAGDMIWTQHWGGVGTDSVLGLAIAPDGALIASGVLGYTAGAQGVPGAQCSGGFVRKLQTGYGSAIWNRDWPLGPGLDRRQDVVISGGELYVSGGFARVPDLTQGCFASSPMVLKLDLASGTDIWTTVLGYGTVSGNVFRLAAAPEGGVLAAMNNTPPPLEGVLRSADRSAAVTMVTPDGTKAWTRNWGSEGLELGYTVDVFQNKAIAAGLTTGPLGGTTNSGGQDGFLAFMDLTPPPEHFLLRANTIATVNHSGIKDSNGNQYTVGIVAAPPASASYPISTTNGADITLTKRDSAGTPLWTRQWGSTSDEGLAGGHSLALALNDSVAVAGTTVGTLPNNTTQGLADAFVTRWGGDGTELWTRQLGTVASDLGSATAIDSQGNIYLVGSTEGTLPGNLSAGKADAFVAKFDPNGTLLWVHQYGSGGDEWVTSATFGADGSLWITGPTTSSWAAVNAGCRDVFLAQIDPSTGMLGAVYQWGSLGDDQGENVATDSAGNLLLASSWNGSDNCILGSDGQSRLAKISPTNGTELWAREWGSLAVDTPTALALDASDNVWVTGFTSGDMDGYANLGQSDIFLTQFWSDGAKVWHRHWGSNAEDKALDLTLLPGNKAELLGFTLGNLGAANSDTGTLLRLTADLTPVQQLGVNQWGGSGSDSVSRATKDAMGNYYLTGQTDGVMDGPAGNGGIDAYVSKTNSDGVLQWTRQLGGPANDQGVGVATDLTGNVLVSGLTQSALVALYGGRDVFLASWSTSGSLNWVRQWGTSADEWIPTVTVDPVSGDIFVVGQTDGASESNVQQGSGDIFISRWTPLGDLIWVKQWGSGGADTPYAALVSSGGSLYVAGFTGGALPGAASFGGWDALIARWTLDGSVSWVRQFGGPTLDFATVVSEDPSDGTLLLGGQTQGTWAGTNLGGTDVFVRRLTPGGDVLWTKQFGSAGNDIPYAVGTRPNGEVFVAGGTQGSLPGFSLGGPQDAYVSVLTKDGRQVWIHQFGTPLDDLARGAYTVPNGGFIIFGTTSGTLGSLSSGGRDPFSMTLWGG